MSWTLIETYFLQSIVGVIVLGAIGSLLASIFKWLVVSTIWPYLLKLTNYIVVPKFLSFLEYLSYPYLKEMRISEEIRDRLLDEKEYSQYQVYLNEYLNHLSTTFTLLVILIVSTVLAFILFWPEFSYALLLLTFLSSFFFINFVKAGIRYAAIRPSHYDQIAIDIGKKYNTFKKYKQVCRTEALERLDELKQGRGS